MLEGIGLSKRFGGVLALREATQAQAARQERTNARAGVAVAVIMGVVFVVLVAVSLVKK